MEERPVQHSIEASKRQRPNWQSVSGTTDIALRAGIRPDCPRPGNLVAPGPIGPGRSIEIAVVALGFSWGTIRDRSRSTNCTAIETCRKFRECLESTTAVRKEALPG